MNVTRTRPSTFRNTEFVGKSAFRARASLGVLACLAALAAICSCTLLAPHAMAATYKDLSGNGYISLEDAQKSCDIRPEHFKALGLSIDPNVPEGVTSPYPEDKVTDLVSQREVYAEANGTNANKYSVRDYLDVLGPKGGSETKAHDSNGDLKGAYNWWKLSNKQPNSDYGGSVASYLSSNKDDVLSLEKAGFAGKYATSVAYSATKGADARDNHVAELRAHAESDKVVTTIGGVTYTGGISVELFSIDKHGKRVSVGSLAPTANESQVLEVGGSHEFKYLDSGYLQEYDAYFEIEAGDVDGDGIDEIFAYAGAYEDQGGKRKAIVDMFKSADGKNYAHTVVYVDAGSAESYAGIEKLKQNTSNWRWQVLKSAPVVTLAAGDLDRNGTEELAVTVSAPNWNTAVGETSACFVFSWDAEGKKMSSAKGLERISLAMPDDLAQADAKKGSGMMSANCAFGTFTIESTSYRTTALVIGGYQSASAQAGDQNGAIINFFAYRYVFFDPRNNCYTVSDYRLQALGKDARRIVDSAADHAAEGKRYMPTPAPLAMGCAQLEQYGATAQGNHVMFGGDVYSFDIVTGASAAAIGHLSLYSDHHNNEHNWSKNKDHIWIGDVVSGIVSNDGKMHESFLAVVGLRRDDKLRGDDDYYWMDLAHFTFDEGVAQAGRVRTGQEGVVSEGNRVGKSYGTYLSLCLPDIDDDGVRMRFKSKSVIPTSPKVLGVLQDAPYFADLDESQHYVSAGATSLGKGRAHGYSNGLALNFNVGWHLQAEWNTVFVAGFDFAVKGGISYSWQMRNTMSYDVTYDASAGAGDSVVVYSMPTIVYLYEVYNPETKQWSDMCCPMSSPPVTSIVSVETWNKVAADTESLGQIDETILNTESGHPETYMRKDALGGTRMYTSTATTSTSTVTGSPDRATTQQITYENEDEHTIEVALSFALTTGFGIGLIGDKADTGLVLDGSAGYTHSEINSRTAVFTGVVDNMPKLDALAREGGDYGFTWKLVVNCIGKNSHVHTEDNLWLVGYELESCERPLLSIPTDVHVSEVGPNSVTLQWGASDFKPSGVEDDCYYSIGLLDSGSTTDRVATWKQVSARDAEFTWDGLSPNTNERFVVKAVRGSLSSGGVFTPTSTSAPSPPVGVRTLEAGESFEAGELVVLEPGIPCKVAEGGQAKFSVTAAWGKDGDPSPDKSGEIQYQWQKKAPGEQDWVTVAVANGTSDAVYKLSESVPDPAEGDAGARLVAVQANWAGGPLVAARPDSSARAGAATLAVEDAAPGVVAAGSTATLAVRGAELEHDGTQFRCLIGFGAHVVETNAVVLRVESESRPHVTSFEDVQLVVASDDLIALRFVPARGGYKIKRLGDAPVQPERGGTVGKTYKVGGCEYKVTSNSGNTVTLVKAKSAKKLVVPSSVAIKDKSYKVSAVANGAFSGNKATSVSVGAYVAQVGSKAFSGAKKLKTLTLGAGVKIISPGAFASNKALKTLVLKTKKLAKKSSVKKSLKGSHVKTVKVKLGSKGANKKYVKKYRKLFAKKNSGKKVVVK